MSASQLFDSTSVSANRHGELTHEQQNAYVNASTSGKGGWLTLALAGVIIVVIVLEFGRQLAKLQGAAQILGFAIIIGVLVVCSLLVSRLYAIPARARIARAHVERKQGQVVFQGDEYRAIADGKPLNSIFGDTSHLLPGSYVFYCLTGTRWLVSMEKLPDEIQGSAMPFDPDQVADQIAERIPDKYKEMFADVAAQKIESMKRESSFDLNGLRAALASAIGFSAESLEANRQGKLSHNQKRGLRRQGGSYLRYGLLFLIFLVAFLAYSVINHKPLDLGGYLAVIVFFGGIGLVLIYLSYRDSADIRRGIVEMTEGSVHKFTRSSGGGRSSHTYHYYGINNMSFEVGHAGYEALIEHVNYRIYYTPTSKKLMSIEPITGT